MKILALFVFYALTVLSSGSNILKTYLPINEKGLHYNQTIEYIFDSDIIIYEVPAHHDILATKTIIHNPSVTFNIDENSLLFCSRIPWSPKIS